MNHTCLCHIPNLQTVVQPVRTEEHAVVHLPMLTVTVPVGTEVPTARMKVFTEYAHHQEHASILN